MSRNFLSLLVPGLIAFAPTAGALPLQFDTPFSEPTGSSVLGDVMLSRTMGFQNVGTDGSTVVDMRVTASVKPQTSFATTAPYNHSAGDAGYVPRYDGTEAEPNNDLGFLFYGWYVDAVEKGITLDFEFFDGTGARSGAFSDPFRVAQLDFAIYDVDGETRSGRRGSTQSEYVTAVLTDGLVGYAVGKTDEALSASLEGGRIRFDGQNVNVAENDPSGAVRLLYRNTDSFSLDFGSIMSAGSWLNPVFTAFDGDLSLFKETDFGPLVRLVEEALADAPASIPLPAAGWLLLASLGGLAMRSRHKA